MLSLGRACCRSQEGARARVRRRPRLCETAVDDVHHALNRHARLRDVRRDHNLRAAPGVGCSVATELKPLRSKVPAQIPRRPFPSAPPAARARLPGAPGRGRERLQLHHGRQARVEREHNHLLVFPTEPPRLLLQQLLRPLNLLRRAQGDAQRADGREGRWMGVGAWGRQRGAGAQENHVKRKVEGKRRIWRRVGARLFAREEDEDVPGGLGGVDLDARLDGRADVVRGGLLRTRRPGGREEGLGGALRSSAACVRRRWVAAGMRGGPWVRAPRGSGR